MQSFYFTRVNSTTGNSNISGAVQLFLCWNVYGVRAQSRYARISSRLPSHIYSTLWHCAYLHQAHMYGWHRFYTQCTSYMKLLTILGKSLPGLCSPPPPPDAMYFTIYIVQWLHRMLPNSEHSNEARVKGTAWVSLQFRVSTINALLNWSFPFQMHPPPSSLQKTAVALSHYNCYHAVGIWTRSKI